MSKAAAMGRPPRSMSRSRDSPGRTISMSESTVTKRSYSAGSTASRNSRRNTARENRPRGLKRAVELRKVDGDEVYAVPQRQSADARSRARRRRARRAARSRTAPAGSLFDQRGDGAHGGREERTVGREDEGGAHRSGADRRGDLLAPPDAHFALRKREDVVGDAECDFARQNDRARACRSSSRNSPSGMSLLANPVVLRWVVSIAKRMAERQKFRKRGEDIALPRDGTGSRGRTRHRRPETRRCTMSNSTKRRPGRAVFRVRACDQRGRDVAAEIVEALGEGDFLHPVEVAAGRVEQARTPNSRTKRASSAAQVDGVGERRARPAAALLAAPAIERHDALENVPQFRHSANPRARLGIQSRGATGRPRRRHLPQSPFPCRFR